MTGTILDNSEFKARATSKDSLETRLRINKEYASANFDEWLLERLHIAPGEHILDVGCGSGAQTIPFASLVGAKGSISALDISAESVALLKARIPAGVRVEAFVADMAELPRLIRENFTVKEYDLTHSSYALYYSPQRMAVLDAMRRATKPGGRLAIFTTNGPHGLVSLAQRHSNVPKEVYDSLDFGPRVLAGYFDQHFRDVAVHHFHNMISIPDAETVMEFYRVTTYYDRAAEAAIRAEVERQVAATGKFTYEKNGYLIIGRQGV